MVFLASPLTFDPSVVDIFLALSSGAQLLIVPNVIKKMPNRLAELLFNDHKTTVLQASVEPFVSVRQYSLFVQCFIFTVVTGHAHSAVALRPSYSKTGRAVVRFFAAGVGSGWRSLPVAHPAGELETRGQ